MPSAANRILLIEDEKNISDSLSLILQEEGFQTAVSETGSHGLSLYRDYDLLVLDLMLPDMDGLEVLRQIRSIHPTYPVLIVSAKTSEDDLIKGLECGADDYISKPFSVKELILRIKRTLTRRELYQNNLSSDSQMNEYTVGKKCRIDFKEMVALTMQGPKKLTVQEANVLLFLISNEGQIVSRKTLLEKIWGYNAYIETRTIDNFIVRFRKYFEDNPKKPDHFLTKRGMGYLFVK